MDGPVQNLLIPVSPTKKINDLQYAPCSLAIAIYAFKINSTVVFTSVVPWLGTGIFKKCLEIDRPLYHTFTFQTKALCLIFNLQQIKAFCCYINGQFNCTLVFFGDALLLLGLCSSITLTVRNTK